MGSSRWLVAAVLLCGLATACQSYNTNLSVQTASSILTFISPSAATAGSQGFTITANGNGFSSGAEILWNGTPLTTTLVSSLQLTAPVPASDLATPGTVQVSIRIPGSAQSPTQNVNTTTTTEVSNVVLFTVTAAPAPAPALTSLSASTTSAASTPACSVQGFTLTVNGTNFTSDTKVSWNGVPIAATNFVSATQLTAPISATQAAFPGTAVVTASNSNGTSGSLPFTLSTPSVSLATPTLTAVTPSGAAAGSPPFSLTPLDPVTLLPASALVVTASQGTFLPCTSIQWTDSNGVQTTLQTEYIPAAPAMGSTPAHVLQLDAAVPAPLLVGAATPQTAHIRLVNPPPVGSGGNTSAAVPFTISPPSPTSLSATSAPSCGASNLTLTVTGMNFVNGSVVDWIIPATPPATTPTTVPLATAFVSSTQLTATIPTQLLVSPGTRNISVSNFAITSTNVLPFTVSASTPPAPTIGAVSPASATAGSSGATLSLTGTNFLPCSTVQWTNGGVTTQLVTTYGGPTSLTATVPAANVAAVGTAQITVATPAASTNTSAPVSFPITLATIASVSASTTNANNAPYCSPTGYTLTVTGTGFAPGLVVNWNGSPRPTTFVSSTQLTAAISAADTAFLATGAGVVAITVSGSGPGTNSNHLPFSLTQLPAGSPLPLPSINSINPTSAALEAATGPPVALTVSGNNISSCSVVQWNGSPLPVNVFLGASGMAAVIPASNLTTVTPPNSPNQVAVSTPALPSSECTSNCGGGTSNSEPFAVFTPGTPQTGSIPGSSLSLPLTSPDQRFAVFVLASTNGTAEIPGSTQNVFVADTCAGASACSPSTTLVSAGSSGATANGDSVAPAISGDVSADGRYVVFLSSATNLLGTPTAAVTSAFMRDTCARASSCTPSTQLISVSTGGIQANAATTSATISPTGRYITFTSSATNLGSSTSSLFLRDTCAGASGCTPSTQPLQ
jgi:hypothetical protein